MDLDEIVKAIEDYEKRSPEDVVNEISPIIDSIYPEEMAERIGCDKQTIRRIGSKQYRKNGDKPTFVLYAKIKSYANDGTMKHRTKRWQHRDAMTKEEKVQYNKIYQHNYYENVTRPKRRGKSKLRETQKEGS